VKRGGEGPEDGLGNGDSSSSTTTTTTPFRTFFLLRRFARCCAARLRSANRSSLATADTLAATAADDTGAEVEMVEAAVPPAPVEGPLRLEAPVSTRLAAASSAADASPASGNRVPFPTPPLAKGDWASVEGAVARPLPAALAARPGACVPAEWCGVC
jgi:hypothetical protein